METKQTTAVSLDFTGFTTVFLLSNCQRWDFTTKTIIFPPVQSWDLVDELSCSHEKRITRAHG